MAGVHNNRPPQPRYTFMWDMGVVLRYIKDRMPHNSKLSNKELTFKLTGLLALASAGRASMIHHLNITFLAKSKTMYKFYFNKLHKSWRNGKPPPEVTYYDFPQDKCIRPIQTLEDYIARSEQWREKHSEKQLLLATINPHQPVSVWLLSLLSWAGIDTDTFKGHSTRSASSSKAKTVGVPIGEVLKRGCWTGVKTWQERYNNDIHEEGRNFQNKVFSGR